MLQTQSVYPKTLELLKRLMRFAPLNDFYLVGGTALSLIYGHRISIDLDLFSKKPFDAENLLFQLKESFSDCKIENMAIDKNTINLFINDIKVAIMSHRYPFINDPKTINGVRILSIEDLLAMKTNAVVQRGSKKDFMDIYEVFPKYTFEDIFHFYQKKYALDDVFHAVRSMTYFDDAEYSENPILLKNQNWETVKETIQNELKKYVSRNISEI